MTIGGLTLYLNWCNPSHCIAFFVSRHVSYIWLFWESPIPRLYIYLFILNLCDMPT